MMKKSLGICLLIYVFSISVAWAASEKTPSPIKVKKIVFIGKKQACDCTKKAIAEGWTALQKALGTPPKAPVERHEIDVDAWNVEAYRKQKQFMALPAIYFLDANGKVLELLQGPLTEAQITTVLKR